MLRTEGMLMHGMLNINPLRLLVCVITNQDWHLSGFCHVRSLPSSLKDLNGASDWDRLQHLPTGLSRHNPDHMLDCRPTFH